MADKAKYPWYIGGLGFECVGCGACCSGPDEGYVWATKKEQHLMADYLKMPIEQLLEKYARKIGKRTSLREKPVNRDCVFLENKKCAVYTVRPNQCRTWPFWAANLRTANDWNMAGMKCPGINRGRLYTYEEIQELKNQKSWWADDKKR